MQFAVKLLRAIFLTLFLLPAQQALAVPVDTAPRYTFAGNVDFAVTAGTLRTQPNSGNACAVGTTSTATLSGIPASATIEAAYLYWAGSGSTADLDVTFAGAAVSADRDFFENYTIGTISLDYFSGFADVTNLVAGNGTYTFGGLNVTTTGIHCSVAAVVSGWGLIVVYEDASNPLRVLNIFDGFQSFRGSSITLVPSNFVVPPAPFDGRLGVLSWEGDVENSAIFNGVTENIVFDGQSTPPTNLTDGFNPLNNQFNSTINGLLSSTSYGVDFDVYDISSRLSPGDSSASTVYSSGGDLVLLSAEVVSVTNTPVADLALDKSHVGDFVSGQLNTYSFQVSNQGPSDETGPIIVTDTLPAGMTYNSFASLDPNWSCVAAGQTVTCTYAGGLVAGANLPTLDVIVDVSVAAPTTLDNTASVAGADFDPFPLNNTDIDSTVIVFPDISTSSKTVAPVSGYPVTAGDTLRYTVTVTESSGGTISGVSVTDILDGLLANLVVVDAAGGVDNSTATTLQIDNLTVPGGGSVEIIFEADVVGSAPLASVIPNTADVLNPVTAIVTSVSSADITVGNVPTFGTKLLYMGDIDGSQNNPVLPMEITRNPLGGLSSPARVRIRRQDNNRVWALSPALQADLALDGSTMPVTLYMRRNNDT